MSFNRNFPLIRLHPRTVNVLGLLGLTAAAALAGYVLIRSPKADRAGHSPADDKTAAALQTVLKGTTISKVNCASAPGALCEVTAGPNIFYATPDARYLFIGRIFDTGSRTDLTHQALNRLRPERMLAGAPGKVDAPTTAAAPSRVNPIGGRGAPSSKAPKTPPQKIDWAELPEEGAIVWGRKGAKKLAVFSDVRCPYCKALHETLKTLDLEVHEYLVPFLSSRAQARAVFCSADPVQTLQRVYANVQDVDEPGADCDAAGLKANERFAAAAGIPGTPFLISEDGRVLPGFPGRQRFLEW
ncbi:MAG: DsbC family protein, partial [bacterium]